MGPRSVLLALLLAASAHARAECGFLDVPGGRVAWERAGSGAPVVLIHDGLLPGARGRGVAPALGAIRRGAAGWASYARAARDGHGILGAALRGFASPAAQQAWLLRIEPLDGTHLMDGRPPVLLQFARRDEYISRIDAALFQATAFPGAESREYDVGHFELGAGDARRDREEWLARLLALPARRGRFR